MKKLFLFTLFISLLFCSCGNLINSKNQNTAVNQGTVILKLGSDAPDASELSRTVGPQDGKPYTEVSEWTVTFTRGDFKQVETLSESSNSFALPVGTGYKVAVIGSVEDYDYYGEATFDVISSESTDVTILVGRKKTDDGRGKLNYTITLGENISIPQSTASPTDQASFFNVKVIDLLDDGTTYSSSSGTLGNDISDLNLGMELSGRKLKIYSYENTSEGGETEGSVYAEEGIKSGYYKLIVSYSVEGTTYYLNIPDPYLEICDDCTTFAEVTVNGVSSTRTYYATAKPSSYNGLTKEFPVNINTLLTTLNSDSGKDGWNTVDIYFDASEDVSSVMDLELPSGKPVNCYSGNIKFIDNSVYVTSFYVSASGTYTDSNDVTHDAAKTICEVAQLINNVDYSDKDVTVRVSGIVYETKDSDFTKVKSLSLFYATGDSVLDYSSASIDAKGLKFNSTVSGSEVSLAGVNITYAGFYIGSDNISVDVKDSSIAVMDYAAGALTIEGDTSGQIKIASGKTLTINPASFNNSEHKVTLCPDYTYYDYQTTASLIDTTPGHSISDDVLAKLQLDNTNWSLTLQGKIQEAGVLYLTSENYTTITSDDLTEGQIIRVLDNNIPAKEGTGEYVSGEVHSLTTLFRHGINNNTKNITVDLSGYTNDISSVWFYNAAAKIFLPDNTTSLDRQAFQTANNLKELEISSSNINFCSIDGVLYSKDVSTLVRYPSAKTDESFTLPNTVVTISVRAFINTPYLKQIPNFSQVTTLSDYCFDSSGIESLVLNDNISSIPLYSFQKSKLKTITLPSKLTSIGGNSFTECTDLTTIIFKKSVPPTLSNLNSKKEFYGCDNLATIYVPTGAVPAYTISSTEGTTESWFTNNNFTEEQLAAMVTEAIIQVSDGEALKDIADRSNNSSCPESFDGFLINITADITITEGWNPIASISGSTFKGTLNGNGHKISVPMTEYHSEEYGFTGLVGINDGTIENIEYYIEGYSDGGDFSDTSKMVNCQGTSGPNGASGSNVWTGQVGGIAGTNNGTIRNCWNRVNFYTPFLRAGGIAGWNNGTIENCVNTGNIAVYNAARNQPNAGGIAGAMNDKGTPKIINCVNYGTVGLQKGYSYFSVAEYTGGIVGCHHYDNEAVTHVQKNITNCYFLENSVCKDWSSSTAQLNSNIICIMTGENENTYLNYLTVSGCGTFNSALTITAGTASSEDYSTINCLTAQTLAYGTNLLTALNGYVSANSSNNLKSWKTIDDKVLLDFTN